MTDYKQQKPLRYYMELMKNQEPYPDEMFEEAERREAALPEPQGPSDEEFGLLHEANNILCAANHALKTIDGVLETTIDEKDGYTFCDLVGDVYSIRRALVLLDGCIKTGGLKGDPVR